MGRTFSESETGAKPAPVIILGYDLWQRKFNGDPHIVGKTIHISRQDTPPTVIGVMPPGVRFLPSPTNAQEPNYNVNAQVGFWIPAPTNPERQKGADVGRGGAAARREPRRSRRRGELAVIAARQAKAVPDYEGITPQVQSLTAELNRDGSRILLPLLGAAALVLLIACGNAAALLLVRGLQRQQEYAVRSALGVGRVALFRQVATESLLLAVLGGGLGVGLAIGVVKLFKLIGGHAIPRLDSVTTGWPVLACGVVTAIFAAVLAGLFPALRASRLDPIHVLKSAGPKSSAGRGERRLLRGVTMVQTALTLALLVGASLLIRTMMNLSKVQSGYSTGQILTMSVTAVQGNMADFHRRALERVSALRRRAVRGVRLGSAADRQQLAGDGGNRRAARGHQSERTDLAAAAVRDAGLFQAAGAGDYGRARLPFQRHTRRAQCGGGQPGAGGALLSAGQCDREEDLDGRAAAAGNGNCRSGGQWTHGRPDAGGDAGSLSLASGRHRRSPST